MAWDFQYQQTTVKVMLWFPTAGEETSMAGGPFELVSVPGARPASKPHPLVVISHGTGGSGIAHHPIAATLARHGFLVAALMHPGDNYQDRSLVAGPHYLDERPRQLKALLRALVSDRAFGPLIDAQRIGAIGHSAGGFTVAAVLGAHIDRPGLVRHCQQANDDPACAYRDPTRGVSGTTDKPFVPVLTGPSPGSAISKQSPRIRSAVLLAPLGSVIDPTKQAAPDVPVQIIVADHDEILPRRYHLSRLVAALPHADVQTASGAGHFSFIAPVNEHWKAQLGEVAIDPPGFDRHAFMGNLGTRLANWFTRTLALARINK